MIGLIDYGMGNLQSVKNSCEYVGEKVEIIRQPEELDNFDGIILPGVGAFALGMAKLHALRFLRFEDSGEIRNGSNRLQEQSQKKPLLGICLGMQLLADWGTEIEKRRGLGLIPGKVIRFEPTVGCIPHVGWNNIQIERENNPLLKTGMAVDYYFVHSYHFVVSNAQDVIATCEYGNKRFVCAVQRGNVFGVQFHPEKSHSFGLKLLKNFFDFCHAKKKTYTGSLS